jgi:hypothetical protein
MTITINPSSASEALQARQARYDRLHHLRRIEWLNSENPCWSCGTRVLLSDVKEMIRASMRILQMTSLAHNHCDLNDSEYIAVLDDFALRNGL